MSILADYSLSIVLAVLFLLSWVGQAYFQWNEFVAHQQAHEEMIQTGEYFNEFMSSTLENWQSEFLQLFSFVVLASFLIHKGSPQSKDGDEEMKEKLNRIERKLDGLGNK